MESELVRKGDVLDQKSTGVKMWTGEVRLAVSESPMAQRNLACGPDMDRSPKEKSDPGEAALM